MTLEDDATAKSRWSGSLLLVLEGFRGDEEWVNLTEAHELATNIARSQFECECTYSTQRNAKRDLIRLGLVDQRRVQQHFEVRLTKAGRKEAERIEQDDTWGQGTSENLPSYTGKRVGKGHLLPRAAYAAMMRAVNAGEVDLIVVPHDKPTKIQYWDEA